MFLRLVQQNLAAIQARLLFGNEANTNQTAPGDPNGNLGIARQLFAENPTLLFVVASSVGFAGSVLQTYGYSAAWGVRLWTLITPGDYLMLAVPIAGYLAAASLFVLWVYVIYLASVAAFWAVFSVIAFPLVFVGVQAYRVMGGGGSEDDKDGLGLRSVFDIYFSVVANITALFFAFIVLPFVMYVSGVFLLASHPGGPTVVISFLFLLTSLIYLGSVIVGLIILRGSIAARVRRTLRRVSFYGVAVALLLVLPVRGANDFYAAQYETGWQRIEPVETAPTAPLIFPGTQASRARMQSAAERTAKIAAAREAAAEEKQDTQTQPAPEEETSQPADGDGVTGDDATDNDEFAIEPPPPDLVVEIPPAPETFCVPRRRIDSEELRFDEPCMLLSLERGVLFIDGGRQKVVFDFFDEEVNVELCYPNPPPDEWVDFRAINGFLRAVPWLRRAYEFLHYEGILDAPERRNLEFGALIDCQNGG